MLRNLASTSAPTVAARRARRRTIPHPMQRPAKRRGKKTRRHDLPTHRPGALARRTPDELNREMKSSGKTISCRPIRFRRKDAGNEATVPGLRFMLASGLRASDPAAASISAFRPTGFGASPTETFFHGPLTLLGRTCAAWKSRQYDEILFARQHPFARISKLRRKFKYSYLTKVNAPEPRASMFPSLTELRRRGGAARGFGRPSGSFCRRGQR